MPKGKDLEKTLFVVWSLLTNADANIWNGSAMRKDAQMDMAIRHCKNVIFSVSNKPCTNKAKALTTINDDQRKRVREVFLKFYPSRKDSSGLQKRRKDVAASDVFKSDIARICSQTKDIFELVIDFIHCCVKHSCYNTSSIHDQNESEKQISGAAGFTLPLNGSLQLPCKANGAGQSQACSSVSEFDSQAHTSSGSFSLEDVEFVADGGIPVKPIAVARKVMKRVPFNENLLNSSIISIDDTEEKDFPVEALPIMNIRDSDLHPEGHLSIKLGGEGISVQDVAHMLRIDLLSMRPFNLSFFKAKHEAAIISLLELKKNGNFCADSWKRFLIKIIHDVPRDIMTYRKLKTVFQHIGYRKEKDSHLEPYIEKLSESIVSASKHTPETGSLKDTNMVLWNASIASSFEELFMYKYQRILRADGNRCRIDINVSLGHDKNSCIY